MSCPPKPGLVPAVIEGAVLADILTNFAENLRKNQPDDMFHVAHDSNPNSVQALPSLTIRIEFERDTLTVKTITVSNTKTAAKDWMKAHGTTI